MSTSVSYVKGGTKIQCDSSVLPRPRPQLAWPVPTFSGTGESLLALTLQAITGSGTVGVLVTTPTALPGGPTAAWTLYWTSYQEIVVVVDPTIIPPLEPVVVLPPESAWTSQAVPNAGLGDGLLLTPPNGSQVSCYLVRIEAGQTTRFATISTTTPVDTTLLDIEHILSDGWITEGAEKTRIQGLWVAAQADYTRLSVQAIAVFNNTLGTGGAALEANDLVAAYTALDAVKANWAVSTVSTDISTVSPTIWSRWEAWANATAAINVEITYRGRGISGVVAASAPASPTSLYIHEPGATTTVTDYSAAELVAAGVCSVIKPAYLGKYFLYGSNIAPEGGKGAYHFLYLFVLRVSYSNAARYQLEALKGFRNYYQTYHPGDSFGSAYGGGRFVVNEDESTGAVSFSYIAQITAPTSQGIGGVKQGTGLTIATDGTISLNAATALALGGVKIGAGISVDSAGVISSSGGGYTLPVATSSILGGVKQGTNITIDAAGVISSSASGGGSVTSVSGTGSVSGLTLTGTVTSTGSLTLGGAITGFEAAISSGTSTYFWKGNKTWAALASTDVTGALGFTPLSSSTGVTSFNTRTGAVSLASTDVTGALGFTPVNKAGDTMTGTLSSTATGVSHFHGNDAGGNLALDATSTGATFLNYYSGTGGVKFCAGNSTAAVATMSATGILQFAYNATGSSSTAASIYKHADAGLVLQCGSGASHDFAIVDAGYVNRIMVVPHGTTNATFIGAVAGSSFNGMTGLGSSDPVMDSVAKVGTATLLSRQDHVHPSDTTRLWNAYLVNKPLGDSGTSANTITFGTETNYLKETCAYKPAGTDHACLTMAYSTAWAVQLAGDWRNNNWYVRNQNSGNWGAWATLLTTGNINTQAATLQAISAMRGAPVIGTYAEMLANTWVTPIANVTFYYATDHTASDGKPGALYLYTGSGWTEQTPSVVAGRVTAGVITAGAVGATSLATHVALVSQVICSEVFQSGGAGYPTWSVPGNNTGTPVGWAIYASPVATKYADSTTDNVIAEFGGNISIGGMKAAVIVNRIKGNTYPFTSSGTWTCPEGITTVKMTLQGPGGAGADGTVDYSGGGGGGGAFIKRDVVVVPGTVYNVNISNYGYVQIVGGSVNLVAYAGAAGSGISGGAGGATYGVTNAVGYHPEFEWSEIGHVGNTSRNRDDLGGELMLAGAIGGQQYSLGGNGGTGGGSSRSGGGAGTLGQTGYCRIKW